MSSTYDFAEPGFVLIDRVNEMNNNWWCEDIRATNPCGEQPLPPMAPACSARSISRSSSWRRSATTRTSTGTSSARSSRCSRGCSTMSSTSTACRCRSSATRSCANAGTAWASWASARRSRCSACATARPSRSSSPRTCRASSPIAGWQEGLELAKEKGAAPILLEEFEVTETMLSKRPEMAADGWKVGAAHSGPNPAQPL